MKKLDIGAGNGRISTSIGADATMRIMEPKQRVSVRIGADAHRMVRMVAADRGVTVQDVLDEIMGRWAIDQAIIVMKEEDLSPRMRAAVRQVIADSPDGKRLGIDGGSGPA